MSATTTTTTNTAVPPRPAPAVPLAPPGPIPFGRLVRVEWRKATDTRAARWLILVAAVGTVGLLLAPLLAKNSIDQSYSSYLMFAALGLSSLLPIVSILTLTTEWTQRTVMTTFTQEPRRSRVISAKVTVSMLMAVGAIVFAGLVTTAALAIATGTGRELDADLGPAKIVGFALFVLVNIGMGVAFGALLHNTAAAIVLFFVLPTIFGFVSAALSSVGDWIDPSRTFNWLLEGDLDGHVPNILVSAALWLVIPLALGFVRTVRREIKLPSGRRRRRRGGGPNR